MSKNVHGDRPLFFSENTFVELYPKASRMPTEVRVALRVSPLMGAPKRAFAQLNIFAGL